MRISQLWTQDSPVGNTGENHIMGRFFLHKTSEPRSRTVELGRKQNQKKEIIGEIFEIHWSKRYNFEL